MTIAHIIGLAVNISMFLIVFCVGLGATMEQATYVLRRPRELARALLSMNAIMLAVSILLCLILRPAPEVQIALVAVALSPVPPILPPKQEKAGGSPDYVVGLLCAAAISSIVVVPLGLAIIGTFFDLKLTVSLSSIAGVIVVSILLPLVAGIIVRAIWPTVAAGLARPLAIAAWVMLIAALVPILVVATPVIWGLVGNGVLVALFAFSAIGLAVGHWLGRPSHGRQTTLALATSARHPGVAIAIASLNFPDAKGALMVVLFHIILGSVLAAPYLKWSSSAPARSVPSGAK